MLILEDISFSAQTETGRKEILNHINWLQQFENIIIKFGRFIPNQGKHFDEILGIWLSSDNQYAEEIS